MRNTTLSGKPSMPSAWSAMVHGKIKPMLEDDAIWQPTYNSLVAAVVAVWITALLIGLAAWAQFALPTAAPAGPSTSPASLHSLGTGAAEATGESF